MKNLFINQGLHRNLSDSEAEGIMHSQCRRYNNFHEPVEDNLVFTAMENLIEKKVRMHIIKDYNILADFSNAKSAAVDKYKIIINGTENQAEYIGEGFYEIKHENYIQTAKEVSGTLYMMSAKAQQKGYMAIVLQLIKHKFIHYRCTTMREFTENMNMMIKADRIMEGLESRLNDGHPYDTNKYYTYLFITNIFKKTLLEFNIKHEISNKMKATKKQCWGRVDNTKKNEEILEKARTILAARKNMKSLVKTMSI